jgi:hypothetical protein
MSRADIHRLPAAGGPDRSSAKPMPDDGAKLAEEIGIAALELAKRAQDAGLHTIGFLLESVALEAGAEAAARQWPADILKR